MSRPLVEVSGAAAKSAIRSCDAWWLRWWLVMRLRCRGLSGHARRDSGRDAGGAGVWWLVTRSREAGAVTTRAGPQETRRISLGRGVRAGAGRGEGAGGAGVVRGWWPRGGANGVRFQWAAAPVAGRGGYAGGKVATASTKASALSRRRYPPRGVMLRR